MNLTEFRLKEIQTKIWKREMNSVPVNYLLKAWMNLKNNELNERKKSKSFMLTEWKNWIKALPHEDKNKRQHIYIILINNYNDNNATMV